MNSKIKKAVEEYQCCGCSHGSDIECYEKIFLSEACGKHSAGTFMLHVGTIFLGLPKGFNRLGAIDKFKLSIFENYSGEDEYNKFNVPVWKHLNENGHTLVRGLSPRINKPFLDIYLENCIDQIDCIEISKEELDNMD